MTKRSPRASAVATAGLLVAAAWFSAPPALSFATSFGAASSRCTRTPRVQLTAERRSSSDNFIDKAFTVMTDSALTMDVLRGQDDRTSSVVIECMEGNEAFARLANAETEGVLRRDAEDGKKLQAGVQQGIDRGVLPANFEHPAYEPIQVLGKTADEVADEIIAKLPVDEGCVVVIVGLSGTGKGTTVNKIEAKLPHAAAWSNGNCFRSLTFLAATHCEQAGQSFDAACLTPENLAAWAAMLEFGMFDGKFDIRINGLGMDLKVSEVAHTLLQEPKVSKNIPAVAERTQGEVVKFASEAARQMGEAGTVVLLEGREQTLNFIAAPYRFCLFLPDPSVIGQRKAAQRLAAMAVERATEGDDLKAVLEECLKDIHMT